MYRYDYNMYRSVMSQQYIIAIIKQFIMVRNISVCDKRPFVSTRHN